MLQDIATLWRFEVQAPHTHPPHLVDRYHATTVVQPVKDYMKLLPNSKEILVHLSD